MSVTLLDELPVGRLFIGGRWEESRSGRTLPTYNPATREVLAHVPLADEADVDLAVTAAHAAAPAWTATPPAERAVRLRQLATALRQHRDVLARLDALNSGNVITGMRRDVDWAAEALDYFAGLTPELKGETYPTGLGEFACTVREPYGVVAKINPYNHPLRFAAEKLAAPLAAGNTVVIKPPEQAPLSSLVLGRLVADLFPPGVVNIVTGDGPTTGAALVRHPLVRRVALIGSVEAGRAVMRAAADGLKVVTLELGGKNPLILFPDVPPDEAAEAAVGAMNLNRAGQSCSSTSRVFVHRDLHDAFVDALLARLRVLRLGLPEADDSQVGCLVSREQYEKVLEYIEAGRREGARLLYGGGPPEDPALRRGFFVQPTLFDGVRPQMRIAQEEIFGPVIAVLTWDDEEEMLRQANAVIYGLSAAIYTRDSARALRVARRLEAGYVWVNIPGGHALGVPYGGVKQSGIGREECLEELLSYTQVKSIRMRLPG
ncbi:MAG: aldehyde dehydrogenase family protein [Armatimonadota bacterium]|nr:aldehyde dehydrogenase family protein [Armatimonadota bacterium]MDR7534585.1 aldehyde dehydrogenase family protein [Armatimonadota bacterium]MDR7535029.1 aldehyde dehydrogenase family protein [Armatimonadota bacterium]